MSVHRNELRAGLLVLIAGGVLIVGMLALAGSGSLFEETKATTAVFANSRGVRTGDPVRFAGMKVGEVEDIRIRPAEGDAPARIALILSLPGDLQVPVDSKVRVTETLTGARIVEIIPGIGEPLGADGELVDLKQPLGLDDIASRMDGLAAGATDAITKAGDLIDSVKGVVDRVETGLKGEKLKKILESVESSAADLAEVSREMKDLVADVGPKVSEAAESFRKVGTEASAMVEETRPEVREILARVKTAADGVAGLFEGEEAPVARTVGKIESAAAKLEEVLGTVGEVGGEAKELVAESRPRVSEILDRLKTTGTNLKAASEDLRAHPWKLLNEPDEEDQRVQKLFNAARNFNSGAEALGEATRELKLALGRDDVDSEAIKALLKRLDGTFERYERVEELFWEALHGERK